MRCCSARLRCRPASLQVDLNIHIDMDMGMDTAIPLLVSLLLACIYIYIYYSRNPDQIRTDFLSIVGRNNKVRSSRTPESSIDSG